MNDNKHDKKQEPDLIVTISGSHPAKAVAAVVLAEALKGQDVKNINHLNYDTDSFEQIKQAFYESDKQSNLSTACVLIIEFEEDHIDEMFSKDFDSSLDQITNVEQNIQIHTDGENEQQH